MLDKTCFYFTRVGFAVKSRTVRLPLLYHALVGERKTEDIPLPSKHALRRAQTGASTTSTQSHRAYQPKPGRNSNAFPTRGRDFGPGMSLYGTALSQSTDWLTASGPPSWTLTAVAEVDRKRILIWVTQKVVSNGCSQTCAAARRVAHALAYFR